MIGLPVPQINAAGELVVQPNVVGGRGSLRDPQTPAGVDAGVNHRDQAAQQWHVQPATALQAAESPPAPGEAWPGGSVVEGQAGKPPLIPEGFLTGDPIDMWMHEEPVVPWDEMHGFFGRPRSPNGQPGLGRERLATAPFEIDIAQPQGNFLLRADAAYNLTKPDRAELFWASPARGPGTETSVDYQDLRFVLEL